MKKVAYVVGPDETIDIRVKLDTDGVNIPEEDIAVAFGVDETHTLPITYKIYGEDIIITVKGSDVAYLRQFGFPVVDIYHKPSKKMILRIVFD